MESNEGHSGSIHEKNSKFKWDVDELESHVDLKIFEKKEETDHVALPPFWLTDPLKGVAEELDESLGRWKPSLKGYLVAYKNVRYLANNKVANMYVDQPWVHFDISATFYTCRPVVGQILKGMIRKVGAKYALCSVFNCFSATVAPSYPEELGTWQVGHELHFKITTVLNRRKGPVIRAEKCDQPFDLYEGGNVIKKIRSPSPWNDLNDDIPPEHEAKEEEEFEEYKNFESESWLEEADITISEHKKKKNKHDNSQIDNSEPALLDEQDMTVSEHKKKKRKRNSSELDILNEQDVSISEPKKKKKKHNNSKLEFLDEKDTSISEPKKKKKEHANSESNVIDQMDTSISEHKKKKKHKISESDLFNGGDTTILESEDKKKKKKKHRNSEPDVLDEEVITTFLEPTIKKEKKHKNFEPDLLDEDVTAVLEHKKKKKKKHKNSEPDLVDDEVITTFLEPKIKKEKKHKSVEPDLLDEDDFKISERKKKKHKRHRLEQD